MKPHNVTPSGFPARTRKILLHGGLTLLLVLVAALLVLMGKSGEGQGANTGAADSARSAPDTPVASRAPDGKALFLANCASCHHPLKPSTGPVLTAILRRQDDDYVYRFMTERKTFSGDSAVLQSIRKHGSTCPEFRNLSQAEAYNISSFILGCRGLPGRA